VKSPATGVTPPIALGAAGAEAVFGLAAAGAGAGGAAGGGGRGSS
jgi:hypothetical protein